MKAFLLALLLSFLAIGARAISICTTPSPFNTSIDYFGTSSHCAKNTTNPCLTNERMLFSAVPSLGCEGYAYSWNFGDGSSASGPGAIHTFSSPGTYKVVLTVIGGSFPIVFVLDVNVNVVAAPATSPTTLMILVFVLAAIAVVRLRT